MRPDPRTSSSSVPHSCNPITSAFWPAYGDSMYCAPILAGAAGSVAGTSCFFRHRLPLRDSTNLKYLVYDFKYGATPEVLNV